jgi:hypothetical protein
MLAMDLNEVLSFQGPKPFAAFDRATGISEGRQRYDESSLSGDVALDLAQGAVHSGRAVAIFASTVAIVAAEVETVVGISALPSTLVLGTMFAVDEVRAAIIDFSAAGMRAFGSNAASVEAFEKSNEIGLIRSLALELTGDKGLSKGGELFGSVFGKDFKGVSWLTGFDLGLGVLKELEAQRIEDRKEFEEKLDKQIQKAEKDFYLEKFEKFDKASSNEDSSSDL